MPLHHKGIDHMIKNEIEDQNSEEEKIKKGTKQDLVFLLWQKNDF